MHVGDTGKRIALAETARYDRRVTVKFQENAWCDESIMKFWSRSCWKPVCENSMHLVMDVHRAQMTEDVKKILEDECFTDITYIPGESAYSGNSNSTIQKGGTV